MIFFFCIYLFAGLPFPFKFVTLNLHLKSLSFSFSVAVHYGHTHSEHICCVVVCTFYLHLQFRPTLKNDARSRIMLLTCVFNYPAGFILILRRENDPFHTITQTHTRTHTHTHQIWCEKLTFPIKHHATSSNRKKSRCIRLVLNSQGRS